MAASPVIAVLFDRARRCERVGGLRQTGSANDCNHTRELTVFPPVRYSLRPQATTPAADSVLPACA